MFFSGKRVRCIGVVVVLAVSGLAACTDRYQTPTTTAALQIGTPHQVFVATTRMRDPKTGFFGFERSEDVGLAAFTVSVPPDHVAGDLRFGYENPNPQTEFVIGHRAFFGTKSEYSDALRQELMKRPPGQREVALFVHGYNSTLVEAAYRMAQVAHDLEQSAVSAIYSWPSRGNPLGYVYDRDSALFARDGLELTLRAITNAGADRVLLVAHSMGSAVSMETLRQIEAREPGWTTRNVSGVILMSPDINVDVFRTQIAGLDPVPEPFIIFVSSADKALNLSATLSGSTDRLGNISDVSRLSDLPVEIIDVTAFDSNAQSGHFVTATSPALLSLLRNARQVAETLDDDARALSSVVPASTRRVGDATEVVVAAPGEIR